MSPLTDLLAEFQEQLNLVRAETTEQVESAGGPKPFLLKFCPYLSADCPDEIEPETLSDYSLSWYTQAAIRNEHCARCPEHGGACTAELDEGKLALGEQAVWEERRLVVRRCAKWGQFSQIQRLVLTGIPEKLAVRASHDVQTQHEEALIGFQNDPRGRVLEIRNTDIVHARNVALRLLWKIFETRSKMWGRYVLGPALIEHAKRFYAGIDNDPFLDLEQCPILLIDSLPAGDVPDWWAQRIGLLLYERWLVERCTIVVTEEYGDLFSTYRLARQIDPTSILITQEPAAEK